MDLPFHPPVLHQAVQLGKQYKSLSYSLYNTIQPSVTSTFFCLTFPQPPHNNKHCVRQTEFKTVTLEVPICFVFFQNDLWVSGVLMELFYDLVINIS